MRATGHMDWVNAVYSMGDFAFSSQKSVWEQQRAGLTKAAARASAGLITCTWQAQGS